MKKIFLLMIFLMMSTSGALAYRHYKNFTSVVPSSGIWEIDSSGNIVFASSITVVCAGLWDIDDNGNAVPTDTHLDWMDTCWTLDEDGNLFPR